MLKMIASLSSFLAVLFFFGVQTNIAFASPINNDKSGIVGTMIEGPVSHTCTQGVDCNQPYSGTIVVENQNGTQVITTFTADDNGNFIQALAPGKYLLVPQPTSGYPYAAPFTVTVTSQQYTQITIQYNTGIA